MFSEEQRELIFDKTDGDCYYCEKELSFDNRGRQGRGAWEVEHLVPRANGGTDHMNNLVPACWPCNLEKGTRPSRAHRLAATATRTARASRRRWRKAAGAVVPGLAVAGAVWAYMAATGPTEQEKQLMSQEERDRLFWKMLLIPALAGLAAVAIIVIISESLRKAA